MKPLTQWNWRNIIVRSILAVLILGSLKTVSESEYPLIAAIQCFIGIWIWYGLMRLVIFIINRIRKRTNISKRTPPKRSHWKL